MHDEETLAGFGQIAARDWGPGYQLWRSIQGLLSQRGPEGTTALARFTAHLAVLAVVLLVLAFSRVSLPDWEIAEEAYTGDPATLAESSPALGERRQNAFEALARAAVPLTTIGDVATSDTASPLVAPAFEPRTTVTAHKVQSGDTLYGIAERYRISAETIMWANNMELNPDLLRLGQELVILPVSGVLHTVIQGETVSSIAQRYKVSPGDIISMPANGLDANNPMIEVGRKLIVPGGTKPRVVPQAQASAQRRAPARSVARPEGAAVGGGRFIWPTSGPITQSFRRLHPAVDIGSRRGSAVKASDSGFVSVAGWSNVGYGNYVVIDHGNGMSSLYAHLDRIDVRAGQSVEQGAVIGASGNTGNSTGPHLHFEIRSGGSGVNPFDWLP